MIDETQIKNALIQFDKLFQEHRSGYDDLYYSKLAILEVCGWIEESMDDMIKRCANKHLEVHKNLTLVDTLIKNTHGFHYEDNFRNMLINIMGIIKLERLEEKLDTFIFEKMKSSLGTLKQVRDKQAHTHIKDTTIRIDGPSVTKSNFDNVYDGLKDIERCIRKMKL